MSRDMIPARFAGGSMKRFVAGVDREQSRAILFA